MKNRRIRGLLHPALGLLLCLALSLVLDLVSSYLIHLFGKFVKVLMDFSLRLSSSCLEQHTVSKSRRSSESTWISRL